ncbi:hypothetical protein FI667_g5079, partial [Globisporangium splendens]
MEMARDLQSLRIENDALRRQNAVLQQQRDEFEQKALFATEIHDELLLALNKLQQIEEQLQNSNATHVNKNDKEAEKIRLQEEMIDSLRADLLQMEFEYKTLAVDREALAEKVSTLLRKNVGSGSGMDSGAYEVIPLGNTTAAGAKSLSSKQQKQLQKAQQLISNLQPKRNIRPVRNNYESENGGFSGVMELPNFRWLIDVAGEIGYEYRKWPPSLVGLGPGFEDRVLGQEKFFVPGPNKLVLPQ